MEKHPVCVIYLLVCHYINLMCAKLLWFSQIVLWHTSGRTLIMFTVGKLRVQSLRHLYILMYIIHTYTLSVQRLLYVQNIGLWARWSLFSHGCIPIPVPTLAQCTPSYAFGQIYFSLVEQPNLVFIPIIMHSKLNVE